MKMFKPFLLTILVVICSTCIVMAQTGYYDTQWKKVDELIQKKNLPKSALEEVKKIYARAKKENQDAQLLKALVYMINLQTDSRENDQELSIQEIEKEISLSKEPANSILKNLLANLYWQYLQNKRYKFYGRTETVNFKKEDISTWTLEDLHRKISTLYLQSINQNPGLLKSLRVQSFEPIIEKGNVRQLRPTIYDLLANSALNYFRNQERDLKKPAYAFEIREDAAFAPAAAFVKHKFITADSLSLQHKALLVYQDLISFHLNDKNLSALVDIDLDRIEFVYQNSVSENKDSLYLIALKYLVDHYKLIPETKQASYLIAAWYKEKGDQYQPLKDTSTRYYKIRAREILAEIVRDSAEKNEGWTNSYNLLKEIDQSDFSFEMEKVNLPGEPFRTLVRYKNIGILNFRLIKADENLQKKLENFEDDNFWNTLVKANPLRIWSQILPVTNDLQQHAVEIKIDALPSGTYYLLASPDPSFNKNKYVLGSRLFYVSNISYVNKQNQFFVLHRKSGQPLSGAAVDLYRQEYNYKTSKFNKVELGSYKTDKNGYFNPRFGKGDFSRDLSLIISYKGERLAMNETYYYDYYRLPYPENKPQRKIFFFTDRSIYRPGQTIFFKGIAISNDKHRNEVAADYKTTIYLRNAHYEVTDSLTLVTNEFGSITGKFQLPQNGLGGIFILEEKSNQANSVDFSVEEYKRPKFSVAFEKVQSSYKVNDTVLLTGFAKAYAGNILEGAKVSYRVVRKPRFIYFWFFQKSWLPPVEQMEITHGETITGKDGKFEIRFTAIPDKKINQKLDPVFDYQVFVDVTDINGETRSGQNTITAGYKSLMIKTALAEKMNLDSFQKISIRTENMNGGYLPSQIHVSITKLIPEQRLIRGRFWEEPDQFVMSKAEYFSYFPYDVYSNENEKQNWNRGDLVLSKTDSSRMNGDFVLSKEKLQPGFYVVEVIAKDSSGVEVKDRKYIELFDPKTQAFNKPEYLWAQGPERSIEPAENATVQVGTSAASVFLVNEVDKIKREKDSISSNNNFSFTNLDREKKIFVFPSSEEDRGGFGLNFFFIKDNRLFQYSDVVDIPWSNKELQIEFATFRDKTLPGSEEKWKVKITGYKNEKIAAEMLASMYDASLDQFREHQWNKPSIWPVYSGLQNWNGNENFNSIQSDSRLLPRSYRSFEKQYDRLIFDDDFRRNYRRGEVGLYASADFIYKDGKRGEELQRSRMVSAVPQIEMARNAPPVIRGGIGAWKNLEPDSIQNVMGEQQLLKSDPPIEPRKNFNETAFFFPDLRTDENGTIEFSFTAPEALTQWKLQTLSHTKELAFGFAKKDLVTQKELMVQPNMPRFLRQGDRMEIIAKIVNLSEKEMTGQAQLELFDASTNQSVDGYFINTFPNQYFTVAAGESETVKFPIQVPFQYNKALQWRIVARSGNFSDGEEDFIPVLSNKILVTETVALSMNAPGTKNFRFEKLLNSENSESLQHQGLTIEYTGNPAWYAVQALPYLMEYPYECAEQIWNRYYANAIASNIVNTIPRIRQIFEKWKTIDTAALLSNLEKNQELKSALLEETPWVLQAKTESEQKKNLGILFDLVRMKKEMDGNLSKLKNMQSSNGGFVWFKGAPDDRYITQYIITGIGRLKNLGIDISQLKSVYTSGLNYLDKKIKEDYDNLVKSKSDLKKQQINSLQVQYLYMRSFFPVASLLKTSQTAFDYYKKQSAQFWMKQNKYLQGMTAISLQKTGDKQTAAAILKSLKETSIYNEELGRYWKENSFGFSWFWWYAPIETQSLMVEAFYETGKDVKTVDELRTWLIKNKQTNNWRTTKATADACYAMLLRGSNWLDNDPVVTVSLGNTKFSSQENSESGTGYFKNHIDGQNVKPEMGNIQVTVSSPAGGGREGASPSWGAVYWQYFEDMDKITTASTPLQLNKKLFIEKNTDRGPVLTPVTEGTGLKVGDKIKVRIELKVDRDMEYVHMKDMRASALEPVNVLSAYKWQGGLGYYENTKDVSTNFFFNYLRKGSYVFEYSLFVSHTGNFSNGITTIQCMYAPEFSAHSEGTRISVEGRE